MTSARDHHPPIGTAEPCILGIDPGLSGGIAFYFPANPHMVTAEDVPVVNHVINGVALADRIAQFRPTMAIIEIVGARPGQGVSSMFNFGKAFGTAIGVVQAAHVPIEFVSSARWKKHFHLDADKEKARAKAINLFPGSASSFGRKKDHGRAEAALLARYAADVLLRRDAA